MNSFPIRFQSTSKGEIQFASSQPEFKCERNQCTLNSVLVSRVKGAIVFVAMYLYLELLDLSLVYTGFTVHTCRIPVLMSFMKWHFSLNNSVLFLLNLL